MDDIKDYVVTNRETVLPELSTTVDNKFSIIVPTHKRTELLKRALTCIKNQDYDNYEVIVCSDGYDFNDELCVRSFNDARFKYHYITKMNVAHWGHRQRNLMMNHCSGDYIFWLNDDNTIVDDYLSFANKNINEKDGLIVFKINHNQVGIILKRNHLNLGDVDVLNVMVITDIAIKNKWQMMYEADFYYIKDVERYCRKNNIPIRYFDKIIGNHY